MGGENGLDYEMELPECPGRLQPGTQLQHRLNIERKFRNPEYAFPSRDRAPSKIINYNFVVIRLHPVEGAGDVISGPEKALSLRMGCAPLLRKEVEFTLNNLGSAPVRRYFDGAYRCSQAALDEILEKWRPNFRLSVVVKQAVGASDGVPLCAAGGGIVVGRGALPFANVYKTPTQQVPLKGIGDGAVQKLYSGEMDLYEVKTCTRVMKCIFQVIINEFSGDFAPLHLIPFRQPIHLEGCIDENFMQQICESNFEVLTESQTAHAFLVRPEVVLKREHRLLFNDWIVYSHLMVLRGLCQGLHACSGAQTPPDLLPDEDLYEDNSEEWRSPTCDEWWGTLEDAIRLGPLFQKSDEACLCKEGSPGEGNDNDSTEEKAAAHTLHSMNLAFFGCVNGLLNLLKSGTLHGKSEITMKLLSYISKLMDKAYPVVTARVALLQKKPLYIRDNERFMVEHLEIFMLMLAFTTVCWTNQVVDIGAPAEQKILRPFDHVVVSTNLKFAGVLRQVVERMVEGSPKLITSKEDLINFLYHPAHEEPLFVVLQSMRDLQSFARKLKRNDPFNCPFTDLDMDAIYEVICHLELLLGIPVKRAMSAWIGDEIGSLHKEFRDDAVQIASLNVEEPMPVDVHAYRADTQLRVRLYVQHTRLESPWVNQVLTLPMELDLPDYSSRGEVQPPASDLTAGGNAALSVANAGKNLALGQFLPGFDTAAGFVRTQPYPHPGKKQENYEWCITADEDPHAMAFRVDGHGGPPPDTGAIDPRQLEIVKPDGVLKIPGDAAAAAEQVVSSFPPLMRESADKAILNNFPLPAPGWFGRVPDADPVTRVTELDTKVTRATPKNPINVK